MTRLQNNGLDTQGLNIDQRAKDSCMFQRRPCLVFLTQFRSHIIMVGFQGLVINGFHTSYQRSISRKTILSS